ncbi:hypothetical protein AB205_0030590 [Aquarana catesbeiana]|uniref:Gamma-tubulin complex component n=1 Tax=Aquarana catesbeiana TaxID=8400 RepID=A0A2G9RG01_AQUCT|nr:hypothetical protein AB205_0030590 [Aquarana catesbeiana]
MDEVTGHCSENPLPGTLPTPKKGTEAPFRTYQAFMWALYKYFMSFKEELVEVEKCIINKDKTVTLAMVVDQLTPRLAQLKVLHKVFSTGIAEVPPDTRNVVRASHLLNTLYKAILEYDNVGEASEQTVSLLFFLWVETVRPYLEIVDEWIVHGHLFDPAKEFIIQRDVSYLSFVMFRNKDVPVNHRDFWYATYTLYSISEKTENEDKMSDNASASSGSDQAPASRQHTMVSFLRPVLKQIIMAGKSMQLLKNLKCKSSQQQDSSRDADRKSLYTLFLESVQSRLQHGKDLTPDSIREEQVNKQSLIKMQSIVAKHLERNDVHDPLLAINFARLSIYFENVDLMKKKLPVHTLDGLVLSYKVPWPVDIVISSECQKIYNQIFLLLLLIKWAKYSLDVLHFNELVSAAEESPKEDLGSEQQLLSHLLPAAEPKKQQIHRMFLLRVKLMHFVNSLHNYMMTRILHSTGLEFQHQVEEAKDLDQLIKIHYRYLSTIHDRCLLREKVPWPVDIVISSECQKIYNQIFLLLLLIKWAKYSLDVLHFNELVSAAEESPKEDLGSEQQLLSHLLPAAEPKKQQIHRMFLLRVKLMHFVNSLHNYMMTRVSSVKEAIMKVMNVVLMFADRWHAGLGAWK